VDGKAARSSVEEKCGVFTLTGSDVMRSSVAFLGSSIGHDGYHVFRYKQSGGNVWVSRGQGAEQQAIRYQIELGNRIGLSNDELYYLLTTIDDPAMLKYWYSPIK